MTYADFVKDVLPHIMKEISTGELRDEAKLSHPASGKDDIHGHLDRAAKEGKICKKPPIDRRGDRWSPPSPHCKDKPNEPEASETT
jgi:hypothetical protein